MAEAVKVAVRCRPFNSREKERNATLIIDMQGNTTKITNPADGKVKDFTFDYSYWSHDGFKERPSDGYLEADAGSKYADQARVMDDLGVGVLENAWNGFHSCVFAYGQTGSGKSYSIVGYGNNKGVIPLTCAEMFRRVEEQTTGTKEFQVEASMMEIYNEKMRDLLDPSKSDKLKIRETKQLGVYVDQLTTVAVRSYKQIERQMEVGTAHRTIGATNMNATSSRAHTVFTITFKQINKGGPKVTETKSVINLVDLAGSERAASTGATGDRLKEGASINSSLTALGQVITALAENSSNPKKKTFVPFRNSVLTRLLQSALGGNSKTVMVAALSPADINFEETLSTLRYADNAKKIKTAAVKNEDPTAKMIRELKEENEKLKALLAGQGGDLSMLNANSGLPNEALEAAQAAATAAEEEAKAAKEAMVQARAEVEEAQAKMAEFQKKMALLESESGWSDELNSLRNELASKDSLIDQLKQAGDAGAVVEAQQKNAAELERLKAELAAAQAASASATATYTKNMEASVVNRAALEVLESTEGTTEVEQRRAVRDALASNLQRSGSTVDAAQVEEVMAKMGQAGAMNAIGNGALADFTALQEQISRDAQASQEAAKRAEETLAKLANQSAEIAALHKEEEKEDEARAQAGEARMQAAIEKAAVKVVEQMEANAAAGAAPEAADEEALRTKLMAQLEGEFASKTESALMQATMQRSVGKLMYAASASAASNSKEELQAVRGQLKKEAEDAWARSEKLAADADQHAREATRQRKALEDQSQQVAALKSALTEAHAAKEAAQGALVQARVDRAAMRVAAMIESGEVEATSSLGALRAALVDEVKASGATLNLDSPVAQASLDANLMRLEAAAQKARVADSARKQVEEMRDALRAEVLEANNAARKAKEEAESRLKELTEANRVAASREQELESLRVELDAAGKDASGAKMELAFKGAELEKEKERLRAKLVAEMEAAKGAIDHAKKEEQSHVAEVRAAEEATRAAQESARIAKDELAAAQALAQEQAKELAELKGKSAAEREQLLKELEAKSQEAAKAGDVGKKLDMQRQMKRISDREKLEREMKQKAQEQLEANEKMMKELGKTWEDKLKQTQELEEGRKELLSKMGLGALAADGVDASTPHLVNLHEDPLMSGQLIHFIKPGTVTVGTAEASDIVLNGVSIEPRHCIFENTGGVVRVEPLGKAVTFLNGKRVTERTVVTHSSRVIIGQSAIFRFADPEEAEKQRKAGGGQDSAFKGVIDWDMAQAELHDALESSVKLKVDEEVERERKAMQARLAEMEEKLAKEKAANEASANAEKEAILRQLKEREEAMENLRKQQFEAEKNAVRQEARAQALEEENKRRAGMPAAALAPSAGAVASTGLGVQRPRTPGMGGMGVVRPGTAGGAGGAAQTLDVDAELASIRQQQTQVEALHQSRIQSIQVSHVQGMADVDSARSTMDDGLAQYKMDLQRIEDELRKAHGAVTEANALADAMGRKVEVKPHVRIEAPEVMGLSPVQELLQVRRAHLEFHYTIFGDTALKKRTTVWAPDEFWRRLDAFREAHAYYLKHNAQPFESRDQDPFYTPPAPEVVGKAVLFLKPLAHRVRLQTWAPILDPSGKTVGELQVALQPTELDFVTGCRPVLTPEEALGTQSAAILRIQQARNLPAGHSTNVFVRYSADGLDSSTTPVAQGRQQTPRFDHRDHLSFGEVTPALVGFLSRDALTLEVVAEPDDVEEGLVTSAPKTAASAAGANPYDGGELPPEVFDFNIAVDLLEGTAADGGEGSQFERARFDGGSNAMGVASGIFTVTHGRPKRILLQCMQGQHQSYPIKHVVSAWVGRVQDVYGNEVEPAQVPLQVLSLSTTPDGRTSNIVANWFRGPPLCDQLTPEGSVFFPTITIEVELRNLDLAAPVALTKMFALRVEDQKPAARNKSYFFSRSSKKGGSAGPGAGAGGIVDEKTQFDDTDAKQRLVRTGQRQQVKVGSLERSDEAIAKQQEEMRRLLEKETAVTESGEKKRLLGAATSQIESMQRALEVEEKRQDQELQRQLLALRQMMPAG